MTDPLDLEPIKERQAHFPALGMWQDRENVAALIAEVERLHDAMRAQRDHWCDVWIGAKPGSATYAYYESRVAEIDRIVAPPD